MNLLNVPRAFASLPPMEHRRVRRADGSGFTLVELSIVLVIIGLLIGAIVVAQSMINTAKITKVVRQLSQFDAAVANFQTRYRQLPGDSNLFSGGNNDGLIAYGEIMNFWSDLSKGVGLENNSGVDYTANGWADQTAKATCPVFDLDQNPGDPVRTCLSVNSFNAFQNFPNQPYYQYRAGSLGIVPTYDPLLPVDVAAIDTKIDDGNSTNTSKLYAYSYGSSTTVACQRGTGYNVQSHTYSCTMIINFGVGIGAGGN